MHDMAISPGRPVLKIQGPPGSGKTRELAREALRLLVDEGIPADRIRLLAVSPLNQARLEALLQDEGARVNRPDPPIQVMLWEGFCREWLTLYADYMTPGQDLSHALTLLNDAEAAFILHALMQEQTPATHPLYHAAQSPALSRTAYELFRRLILEPEKKARFTQLDEAAAPLLPYWRTLFKGFVEKTRSAGLLTYPELPQRLLELLDTLPELGEILSRQVSVLLVDEAQELSAAQFALLRRLHPQTHLVLSGGEALSIRAHRGARPEFFARLHEHFPRLTDLTLPALPEEIPPTLSLRNNEPVLRLLSRWSGWSDGFYIETQPVSPDLTDEAVEKSMVRFGRFADPAAEVHALADWMIDTMRADPDLTFADFAILLRSARYRSVLLEVLGERGIPFELEGLCDGLLQYYHFLYDGLRLIEALEGLGWRAQVQKKSGMTILERQGWVDQANEHLRRFLLSELLGWTQDEQAALIRLKIDEAKADTLVIEAIIGSDALPASVRRKIMDWVSLYEAYQAESDFEKLLWNMLGWVHFLEPHKTVDSGRVIPRLAAFIKTVSSLQEKQGRLNLPPLSVSSILSLYEAFWTEQTGLSELASGVRVLSAHQAQGEEWRYVALPFMTMEEWPQYRRAVELLPDGALKSLGLEELALQADHTAEETKLLASAMTRASSQLVMSLHVSSEGKPVLASPFFEDLRKLSGWAVPEELPDAKGEFRPGWLDDLQQGGTAEETELPSRYEGGSHWAELSPQTDERIFEDEELLELSPTGINTYMKCPRQFYYKHVLRLSEPDSEAASIGSLVHGVLEVFNRNTGRSAYNAENLKALVHCFLDAGSDEEVLQAGFSERDINRLKTLSPLKRRVLRRELLESVDDLERKGYFRDYAGVKAIEAEQTLEQVAIAGLEGCVLKVKMDALIQHEDGRWEVLDYKTSRTSWASNPDNCRKNLQNVLSPLPDEEGLSHAERFAKTDARPRDYQLPLYYLALRQERPVRSVGLQMVRPRFPERPEQGAIKLSMEESVLAEGAEQVISDLNRFIVGLVRGETAFPLNVDRHCLMCSYRAVCEAVEPDGEEEA